MSGVFYSKVCSDLTREEAVERAGSRWADGAQLDDSGLGRRPGRPRATLAPGCRSRGRAQREDGDQQPGDEASSGPAPATVLNPCRMRGNVLGNSKSEGKAGGFGE